jgi:hypothetical protein
MRFDVLRERIISRFLFDNAISNLIIQDLIVNML